MDQDDVDSWVEENSQTDSWSLLNARLPHMRRKLNSLDKRIRDVLSEVQEEFPDACYYTASGGFNLILGEPHADPGQVPQDQRWAWGGDAAIGDGDW